jgi:hypothetical protein
MRVLTINELLRLTRTELCGLAAKIAAALPTFREGSPQRLAAQINLCNIRRLLASEGKEASNAKCRGFARGTPSFACE